MNSLFGWYLLNFTGQKFLIIFESFVCISVEICHLTNGTKLPAQLFVSIGQQPHFQGQCKTGKEGL